MKYILIALLFLSSGFVFAQKGQALPPNYLMGQAFPDSVMQMQLQNIEGQTVSFESILQSHASKKVVLDLWASWCRDCIITLPDLNNLMFRTKDSEVDYPIWR